MEPVRLSAVPAVSRKYAADAKAFALVGAVLAATFVVGTVVFAPFAAFTSLIGLLVAIAFWQGDVGSDPPRMVGGTVSVTYRAQCPVLWDAAQECAVAAGMPVPRLYLLGPTVTAQAASWGMGAAASIGVQASLVRQLPAPWIKAAVAHEFAHLRMGDVGWSSALLIGRIWSRWASIWLVVTGFSLLVIGLPVVPSCVAVIVGALGWIASIVIGVRVMPGVRYRREYAADALGVAITRDPVAAVGLMLLFAALSNDRDVDPRPKYGRTHPPPLLRVQAIVEVDIQAFFGRP